MSRRRSNLKVDFRFDHPDGSYLWFDDGTICTVGSDYDLYATDLTYASALNLASKLLQWATNLPEAEKGNIHKIDGEWVDVDGHSTD